MKTLIRYLAAVTAVELGLQAWDYLMTAPKTVDRSIRIFGAQTVWELETHRDAYRLVRGEISMQEYDERQNARNSELRQAYLA